MESLILFFAEIIKTLIIELVIYYSIKVLTNKSNKKKKTTQKLRKSKTGGRSSRKK